MTDSLVFDVEDLSEPDPVVDESYIVEYTVFYSDAGSSDFVPLVRGETGVGFSEDEVGIITKHCIIGDLQNLRKTEEAK